MVGHTILPPLQASIMTGQIKIKADEIEKLTGFYFHTAQSGKSTYPVWSRANGRVWEKDCISWLKVFQV
jgi:hypothetical protein